MDIDDINVVDDYDYDYYYHYYHDHDHDGHMCVGMNQAFHQNTCRFCGNLQRFHWKTSTHMRGGGRV